MITIRQAEPRDAAPIADIYAPFCLTTAVSFEEQPPSAEELAHRIARLTTQFPWLVLDVENTVAGYAYASPHRERAAYRWSVDVTVYVHESFRGRGTGRALYTVLLALLREQGYFQAFAGVALPNPASEGFHEAMGFTEVGVYRKVGFKLGSWRDVRWYSLSLREPTPDPQESGAISLLIGSPTWEQAVCEGLAHFHSAQPGASSA